MILLKPVNIDGRIIGACYIGLLDFGTKLQRCISLAYSCSNSGYKNETSLWPTGMNYGNIRTYRKVSHLMVQNDKIGIRYSKNN